MNDPSNDDACLFLQAVGDARKLKNKKQILDKPKPQPNPAQKITDDEKTLVDSIDNISDGWFEPCADKLCYARDGISRQVMRKLRSRRYIIEAELDLHGLRSDGAKKELILFINQCISLDYRCVRIIHGKGQRSPNNQPVLKTKTAVWLKQIDEILAYCSALINDGGTGAMYVLLKKR